MGRLRTLPKSALLASVLLLLMPLTACHPEPVVPQDARVLIIDPAAESTLTTNAVTIKTFVERFSLVNRTGEQNVAGEGHIVYCMDSTPPLEQGKSAISENVTYAISSETSYTWNNVQPGVHTFWVQLVNNDNTPLEPPAAVRVYVTVR